MDATSEAIAGLDDQRIDGGEEVERLQRADSSLRRRAAALPIRLEADRPLLPVAERVAELEPQRDRVQIAETVVGGRMVRQRIAVEQHGAIEVGRGLRIEAEVGLHVEPGAAETVA